MDIFQQFYKPVFVIVGIQGQYQGHLVQGQYSPTCPIPCVSMVEYYNVVKI